MNRRAFKLVPLALVIVTMGALLAPAVATADPIGDKQAEAAQLEAQISTNAEKLSTLNEQINSAQNQLAEANAGIAAADAMVAAAQAKTKELRSEVARRAAAVYTQSGSTGGVEELDSQNAQELSTRQKYSSLAAQRDKQIVNELARAKEQLAVRKADAEEARQTAQSQSDAIQAQKDKLDAGQAELQKLNSKVTGELATLVQQAEQERQAREAAAARAQYALAVQNAPAADTGGGGGGGGGGGTDFGGGGGGSATPPATSGGVGAVLAYAYAQLGKPYCYAGVGPSCYDCSGLTMQAWAQAGVMMSHGSYDQMASFPSVSMDQLQPGDLVFWDGHVGIYVGNNSVLHAPHTGVNVQITGIWPGVIGAVRPG
jgi:cell wall-associated NlpC family hydrolase